MSDENDREVLEREAARAMIRVGADREDFRLHEERITDKGWWAVLRREDEDEAAEDVFVYKPVDGPFVSVSASLAVANAFWCEAAEAILAIASEFDVATTVNREDAEDDEVFLILSQRVFLDGLTPWTSALAIGSLTACRDALEDAFDGGDEEA